MSRAQRRALALATLRLRRAPGISADKENLEILSECRSYHLGWILYARSLITDRRKDV
jgi:hypothetical protein